MLINDINPDMWEMDFKKKFSSFCKKCPIQILMYIKIQNGERGALVKHPNSSSVYFFPIDYEMPVKDFIAGIKETLMTHYPRMYQVTYEKYEKTPEELAEEAENGINAENLNAHGLRETAHTLYLLDKVMPWNNQAILKVQTSDSLDGSSSYIYQYNKSISNFLRAYRSGQFSSIEEATEDFFSNAKMIKELNNAVKSN